MRSFVQKLWTAKWWQKSIKTTMLLFWTWGATIVQIENPWSQPWSWASSPAHLFFIVVHWCLWKWKFQIITFPFYHYIAFHCSVALVVLFALRSVLSNNNTNTKHFYLFWFALLSDLHSWSFLLLLILYWGYILTKTFNNIFTLHFRHRYLLFKYNFCISIWKDILFLFYPCKQCGFLKDQLIWKHNLSFCDYKISEGFHKGKK